MASWRELVNKYPLPRGRGAMESRGGGKANF